MINIKNKVGRPLKIDKEIKIAEHFMLSQETDAALRGYANTRGIPISEVLEESVKAYVGDPKSEKRLEIEKQMLDFKMKMLDLKKELDKINKNGGKYE